MAPHQHAEPLLKKPWRQWACPECSPQVYDTLMTPDNDPHSLARQTVTCPFCGGGVHYRDGRIARHFDDTVECRSVGLSMPVAADLFTAIRDGSTAARFVRDSIRKRTARRIALGIVVADVPKVRPPTIPQQLRWLREEAGLKQGELGFLLQTISEWERGTTNPRVVKVIPWAAALGRQLAVAHPDLGPFRRIRSATEAAWWLGEQRRGQAIRANTMAQKLGWRPDTLTSRESGKSANSVTLRELVAWVEAIDFRLELVESE